MSERPVASAVPLSAPPALPALEIVALTKTFAGGRALDGVDLRIAAGEVQALLGENGSGKSTLIKTLSGYHRPDPGASVSIGGRELEFGSPHSSYSLGARFVHQDLGLVEDASIADNLAFGPGFPTRFGTVREREARRRAHTALAAMGVEVDPRLAVSKLSPAQKTGVAVARALLTDEHSPARLLVLDEPTARLPEEEVAQLLMIVRTVAAAGIGVLYVTHRLDEVFDVADRVTVLRDGRRVATEPIDGLTRDALLHHLFGATLERAQRRSQPAPASEAPLLRVLDLHTEALHGVGLQLRRGEILGVAGVTGSGREALCGAIFGARPRDAGLVEIAGRPLAAKRPDLAIGRGVAYVPAERKLAGCFTDLPARENITVSNLKDVWTFPFIRRGRERQIVRGWFDRLGVRPGDAPDALMSSFSGGNQQKIVYGKWFQRKPALFLLDEPTQGVDVGAKAELHSALFRAAEDGAAVLISSTDVEELVHVCDRVVVLLRGRLAAEFEGTEVNVHALTRASLGIDAADEGVA